MLKSSEFFSWIHMPFSSHIYLVYVFFLSLPIGVIFITYGAFGDLNFSRMTDAVSSFNTKLLDGSSQHFVF